MSENALDAARTAFDRIMVEPAPADLWQLQKALLVIDGEPAERARAVARAFHACLRELESKSASRAASRWGAVLGTAAVGTVSLSEMDKREDALHRLLQSGVPAMLEIGSAVKSAEAWEVEAGLVYDGLAWFLYDELWDVSATARPDFLLPSAATRSTSPRPAARRLSVRRRTSQDRGQCLQGGTRRAPRPGVRIDF